LSDFGYFIPIFIPWLDVFTKFKKEGIKAAKALLEMLLPNALYFTVSQDDFGYEFPMRKKFPLNVFVFSGTNHGNVPIPMNIQSRQTITNYTYENRMVFLGNVISKLRKRILGKLQNLTTVAHFNGTDWIPHMRNSTVHLVLPGMARGTFRLKEIMDMGGIPAIIFKDYPWIPYYRVIPYEDFGFVVQEDHLPEFVKQVHSLKKEDILRRRALVRQYAKRHFTIDIIMKQIHSVLLYGFTRTDLRCAIYRYGKNPSILRYHNCIQLFDPMRNVSLFTLIKIVSLFEIMRNVPLFEEI
jgi:hypothetical protein